MVSVDEGCRLFGRWSCAAAARRFSGRNGRLRFHRPRLRVRTAGGALYYAQMLGRDGFDLVAQFSTLNANYLAKRLANAGFDLAYPTRRATHEFLVTFSRLAKEQDVSAMDFAKRLLDYGRHSPTTYFPLLVPECWLIDLRRARKNSMRSSTPAATRTNSCAEQPSLRRTLPVKRLDDVRAARRSTWYGSLRLRRARTRPELRRARPGSKIERTQRGACVRMTQNRGERRPRVRKQVDERLVRLRSGGRLSRADAFAHRAARVHLAPASRRRVPAHVMLILLSTPPEWPRYRTLIAMPGCPMIVSVQDLSPLSGSRAGAATGAVAPPSSASRRSAV